MTLPQLIVLNRKVGEAALPLLPDACTVSTCLREVRIASLPVEAHPSPAEALAAGYERHTGAAAYLFLLQLACGLQSEIPGETEILGQIKQAWRDCEAAQPGVARTLRSWMQRLLQDTKEVRSEYVVGLGSATYGSLVRRLLGGTLPGPTLLLGAGQLAETILPFLDTGEVLVWNRSPERARQMLARQRSAQIAGRVHLLDAEAGDEAAAWQRAHDVVICVPADAARRCRWFARRQFQSWLGRSGRLPGFRLLIHDDCETYGASGDATLGAGLGAEQPGRRCIARLTPLAGSRTGWHRDPRRSRAGQALVRHGRQGILHRRTRSRAGGRGSGLHGAFAEGPEPGTAEAVRARGRAETRQSARHRPVRTGCAPATGGRRRAAHRHLLAAPGDAAATLPCAGFAACGAQPHRAGHAARQCRQPGPSPARAARIGAATRWRGAGFCRTFEAVRRYGNGTRGPEAAARTARRPALHGDAADGCAGRAWPGRAGGGMPCRRRGYAASA